MGTGTGIGIEVGFGIGIGIEVGFGIGIGIGIGAVLSGIPVGACACGAEGRMASIGPPALGAKGCVRFAQGAADWQSEK